MNLILFCSSPLQSTDNLISTLESYANIIIAILTLILGYYVFIYQKRKDIEYKKEADNLYKKSIKMQWFKEIIIQPRIDRVFTFYENITSIKSKFQNSDLSEQEKIKLLNYIKEEQSSLRKSFLDLIQHISADLHESISNNIDQLTDNLTKAVSNDELKLNNSNTYEREINSKIHSSYNEVLSFIFNYIG